MFFSIAFAAAMLAALYFMFEKPAKRWLRGKVPFPSYDPSKVEVIITYDEGDRLAESLAMELYADLYKRGISCIQAPQSVVVQLPSADSTQTLVSDSVRGVRVDVNRIS